MGRQTWDNNNHDVDTPSEAPPAAPAPSNAGIEANTNINRLDVKSLTSEVHQCQDAAIQNQQKKAQHDPTSTTSIMTSSSLAERMGVFSSLAKLPAPIPPSSSSLQLAASTPGAFPTRTFPNYYQTNNHSSASLQMGMDSSKLEQHHTDPLVVLASITARLVTDEEDAQKLRARLQEIKNAPTATVVGDIGDHHLNKKESSSKENNFNTSADTKTQQRTTILVALLVIVALVAVAVVVILLVTLSSKQQDITPMVTSISSVTASPVAPSDGDPTTSNNTLQPLNKPTLQVIQQ